MWQIGRLTRRFFYLMVVTLSGIAVSNAAKPATTVITDIVYRADSTPAQGEVLISWPAFTTAEGSAVAAGTKSVKLGAGGTFSVELVPNTGATPAGTYYTAVFQLDDAVKTEYWVVPTSSPTTLALVRTTPGTTGSAGQMATKQYVDVALASKASDSVVVHVSGAETISGAKQFATSPKVPAPAQPEDAVNKGYVDGLVSTTGSGSYVSKAGDTMTGPLMLAGDPTAPNHAVNRQYVDTGLATKADLALGLVPASELGSGTANGTTCLKGDSTWGACGTSANAISIQNVPVDTSAPGDNQVLTYEASSGKYKPKAGGGVTAGMQAVKYATDFNWSANPSNNLAVPGAVTVNLVACPAGVIGSEPEYWVYVSSPGASEAVKVTGGTCAGNGNPGTLQFTTTLSHPAGYVLSSASSGLQEALIAGRFIPTNPAGSSQSGKIIVPPGEYHAYARVSVRASNVTVDMRGSILECHMDDSCLFVGDPNNSTAFQDVTILNPRGRPMVVNGTKPFIEVNAQKTRLEDVLTRIPPTGGSFGTYVQVDNDQAFLLDGLDTSIGHGPRCDATFCGAAVTAPGPFATWAAVGWLKNLNISNQCKGNGVDWQSGNTLKISDSVIQGYAQYGLRGGRRGGYGGMELSNVYEEVGNCSNPLGNIGQAGAIVQGHWLNVRGGEAPTGRFPQFANTGSNDYRYYIVARHATYGASNPLYVGSAASNGSGTITVTTPDIAGASTFDLLRTIGGSTSQQAPYGTGNYGVSVGVPRASACANGVCTFSDTQAALSSYTVSPPTYLPLLDFWPGNLVLSAPGDTNSVMGAAIAYLDATPGGTVSVAGSITPTVFSNNCNGIGSATPWGPLWQSCLGTSYPPSVLYEQPATIVAVKPNADGGQKTNLKGRLNFSSLGTGPGHIITLSDSNFQKTIATANNRPTNDANDAYIGYDQSNGAPATVGISLGAPKSISSYIGNVGDGTNWLERLTSNLKEFKTDVKINGNLTVTGTCSGCGGGGTSTNADTVDNKHVGTLTGGKCLQSSSDGTMIVETAAACGSGGSGAVASIFGRTGTVTAQAGDYTVAQITGAEATVNKGVAGGYASLDAGGKVPNGQLPSLTETQITGLTTDLATKLGNSGPQTFTGDLTVTGKVTADSFQSTGAGAWSVEGAYGTLSASAANKSKLGFGANGKLSVSENGGAVTEVAKKTPQEFTYTFFDPNNPLTMSLQVPSIYINRATPIHLIEVYCEIDAGSATINLQTAGGNILSSDLVCTTAGAASTSIASGKDAISLGQKINHVTVAAGAGLHRMNVVVKYTVD